ncbi:hypothetical protein M3Y99_00142000 [Aphelenchoides fujianensis]|nr:hypothetical protein M3Y99_00142000 [Aphelenchoides fujianensis]
MGAPLVRYETKACFERWCVSCNHYRGSTGCCNIPLRSWSYLTVVYGFLYCAAALALGFYYSMYYFVLFHALLLFCYVLLLAGRITSIWNFYIVYIVASELITTVISMMGLLWIIYGASNGRIFPYTGGDVHWNPIPYTIPSRAAIITLGCLLILARIPQSIFSGMAYSDFHHEYLDQPDVVRYEDDQRRRCCV